MSDNNMTRPNGSIPILVDNSLNRAIAIKYAIFALFGLGGAVSQLPSLAEFVGGAVATLTSAVICVSASFAAVGAWNHAKGIAWEKMEIYSSILFVSFTAIWCAAWIWLWVGGDGGRLAGVPLSLALLVIPIWRIRHLIKKNRK